MKSRPGIEEIDTLVLEMAKDEDFYPCSSEPEVLLLLYSLVMLTRPNTILELGTFKGAAALYMALALSHIGAGKIITVDIHDHAGANFQKSGLGAFIKQIIGSSQEVLPGIKEKIDLAFVDTVHEYDHVMMEFAHIDPLLTSNGLILFHDTIAWEGVGRAVQEIQKLSNYEGVTLSTPLTEGREIHRNLPSGITLIRKIGAFVPQTAGDEIDRMIDRAKMLAAESARRRLNRSSP